MSEEVSGKVMGIPLSIKGINMGLLLCLCLVMAFTGWMMEIQMQEQHNNINSAISLQTEALKAQTDELTKQSERGAKATEEQTWLLFYATEEQKQKIRDAKKIPEGLKDILR